MILKAKAYAKINLFLQVLGKRSDGYHELDTIMQSVSLFDELELTLTDDNEIKVLCSDSGLCGEENIVYRAAKLFFEFYGKSFGVKISLKKKIPVAAGLGGGSADAAAVLLLLNKTVGNKFKIEELLPLAEKLGADVPFCLVGGTLRCRGVGEQLSEVPSGEMYFVLLKEFSKKSTGQMFALLDSTDYNPKYKTEDFILALESGNLSDIASKLFNSFDYCWNMGEMIAPFLPYTPLGTFLSGSGPTVCALFADERSAKKCCNELINKGLSAFFASSVKKGTEIE